MKLYGFFRSAATFRVRIALGLKNIAYERHAVHLRRGGGEQFHPDFLRLNPQAMVPVLVDGDAVLTQSLAIIEYLDETHPHPPLLPAAPLARARVRALAQAVACDIHPFHAPRVLIHLERKLGLPPPQVADWACHWVGQGLDAVEAALASSPDTGRFCHGDTPTLADVVLVPQFFTARRHGLTRGGRWPAAARIVDSCMDLPAFDQAQPARQDDRDPWFEGI